MEKAKIKKNFPNIQIITIRLKERGESSMDSLGQRIVHYRKKAGLSQKGLAAAIGTSSSVLSYYEKNVNDPPTVMLAKMAEVLDITSDKLLGLDRPHPPAVYRNRNEYVLLRALRGLNSLGQDRALEYISQLSELRKYTEKE